MSISSALDGGHKFKQWETDHVLSAPTQVTSRRIRNCSSPATRRKMRFVPRSTHGWMAIPWVLLIAVLVNARRPPPLPRSFRELSPDEVSSLVDTRDALKNLDTNDPNSHLSKILIPRPGECIQCLKPCPNHVSMTTLSIDSGHRK